MLCALVQIALEMPFGRRTGGVAVVVGSGSGGGGRCSRGTATTQPTAAAKTRYGAAATAARTGIVRIDVYDIAHVAILAAVPLHVAIQLVDLRHHVAKTTVRIRI